MLLVVGTAVCEDMVCNHVNPAFFLVFKDCMGSLYGMVHSVPFSSNFGEFHAYTTTGLVGTVRKFLLNFILFELSLAYCAQSIEYASKVRWSRFEINI